MRRRASKGGRKCPQQMSPMFLDFGARAANARSIPDNSMNNSCNGKRRLSNALYLSRNVRSKSRIGPRVKFGASPAPALGGSSAICSSADVRCRAGVRGYADGLRGVV